MVLKRLCVRMRRKDKDYIKDYNSCSKMEWR